MLVILHSFPWAPTQEIPGGRPFTNLLTPPGLVKREDWRMALPPYVSSSVDPDAGAMPWQNPIRGGPWIEVDGRYRQVTHEEMCTALGVSREMEEQVAIPALNRQIAGLNDPDNGCM